MAFRYDIYIQVADLDIKKLRFYKLSRFEISDINLDLWRDIVHIGYHEHDDEIGFLLNLFSFLGDHSIEKIYLDGLEAFIDELKEYSFTITEQDISLLKKIVTKEKFWEADKK